jgi:hypothetical protein
MDTCTQSKCHCAHPSFAVHILLRNEEFQYVVILFGAQSMRTYFSLDKIMNSLAPELGRQGNHHERNLAILYLTNVCKGNEIDISLDLRIFVIPEMIVFLHLMTLS